MWNLKHKTKGQTKQEQTHREQTDGCQATWELEGR